MGNSSIGFYSGNADIDSLRKFTESLGLHLVPLSVDGVLSENPELGPYWTIVFEPNSGS